jgi:hypothetical protein
MKPLESGSLQYRYGYSIPQGFGPGVEQAIHSIIYYEPFSAAYLGDQSILYGIAQEIYTYDLATALITGPGQFKLSNPWGHFRANNYIYISNGGAPPFVSNPYIGCTAAFYSSDMVSWDGTKIRKVGLPDAGVLVNGQPNVSRLYANVLAGAPFFTSDAAGSFAPTTLSGYELFIAVYNPITQHMGNRSQFYNSTIAGVVPKLTWQPLGPLTVGDTASALIIPFDSNLLSNYDSEWVFAVGMTNDGGQVPYWLVDANGNNIVIGNTATQATIYIGNVNVLQELPFQNDPPPPLDKFARVGTRMFGALAGNPYMSYSNDITDVTNGNYVGLPQESWPADQQEPLPNGELPTSIHAYRLEGWFFSRNNLFIWSQFLLQQGANPWRGPWPGGCPGQRAFVETPYGPYWLNAEAQLCTFMEDGVISVSSEYETSLLAKISKNTINTAELAYLKDATQFNDEIVIRGLDANGNPVIVVHDFQLQDERSPHGQGYNFQYTGITINTFAGAGFTPRQNVYDTNGRMRLWAGCKEGDIAQIEDGLDDNGNQINGDYIGLVNVGPNKPVLVEMEWQGDGQAQYSYTQDYSQGLDGLISIPGELIPGETSRYAAKMQGEAKWVYCRFQLSSHAGVKVPEAPVHSGFVQNRSG